MTKEQFPLDRNEPLDPQLAALLGKLHPTPPRDPEAVSRGRARFLADLDASVQNAPASYHHGRSLLRRMNFLPWIFRKNRSDDEEDSNMNTRQAFVLTGFALVLVVAIFVLGSAGITVAAAQATLPGDALYPVKTGIEQTRLALARDAGSRSQIMMGLAERRLAEIERLAAEGRYEDIETPTREFEAQIYSALAELEAIFAGDPERASELAGQITAALSRYASTLSTVSANAPETVKPSLTQALHTAEIASTLRQDGAETEFLGVVDSIGPEVWTVSGIQIPVNAGTEVKGDIQVGDAVKIHISTDGAGNRFAREIEPARLGGTPDDDVDDRIGDDDGFDDDRDDEDDDNRGSVDDDFDDDDSFDDDGRDDNGDDRGGDDGGSVDDADDDLADDDRSDDSGDDSFDDSIDGDDDFDDDGNSGSDDSGSGEDDVDDDSDDSSSDDDDGNDDSDDSSSGDDDDDDSDDSGSDDDDDDSDDDGDDDDDD